LKTFGNDTGEDLKTFSNEKSGFQVQPCSSDRQRQATVNSGFKCNLVRGHGCNSGECLKTFGDDSGEDLKTFSNEKSGFQVQPCSCEDWPTPSPVETRAGERKCALQREVQGAKWLNVGADIVKKVRFENFGKELKDHDRAMNLLTKDDKFVGAVAKEEVPGNGAYKIIEAVVDSGAEESVAPPGLFPGAVVPSRMSRAGGRYRAANGARIPNLGQVKVRFENGAGDKCGTTFQVAEVERPLLSATQLAASGNAVVIDQKGARIVNQRTKKSMDLVRRGGVLVLRMKVRMTPAPGFPGPGR
jgi:hypothetical protein